MEASPVLKVSHAKITGGLTTLYAAVKGWRPFLAQNLSTVPCFRGVKGASRESHERGCRSHRAASETVLFVGDKRVGVVALRYKGRPKTVGAWLITWWTFWCSFIPPVLIFLFLISTGGNEIERPKSREQIYSPDFEMACRFGTGSGLPPYQPDNRRKAFQFQVWG